MTTSTAVAPLSLLPADVQEALRGLPLAEQRDGLLAMAALASSVKEVTDWTREVTTFAAGDAAKTAGSSKLELRSPDGLGLVTYTAPGNEPGVEDLGAFTDWVDKNAPGEIERTLELDGPLDAVTAARVVAALAKIGVSAHVTLTPRTNYVTAYLKDCKITKDGVTHKGEPAADGVAAVAKAGKLIVSPDKEAKARAGEAFRRQIVSDAGPFGHALDVGRLTEPTLDVGGSPDDDDEPLDVTPAAQVVVDPDEDTTLCECGAVRRGHRGARHLGGFGGSCEAFKKRET